MPGGRPPARTWRDLRTESGLTLRKLEERTGINRGELSRIERGRTCPTPDQATTMLAVLFFETTKLKEGPDASAQD